ncbi:acyltransferase [Streptomyces sp. ZL-24]|uniref:acyltransferase n=1 Tax=Streptomyces sp. ZL-24 TaxID=1933029 RepID=UPI001F4D397B|nr:acyltransferase [Streptomyces sp. ZL-24]
MPSTEATLRLTGERQADLAAGLGLNQTQISRKQSGTATWTLADVDKLSAHSVGDVLVGVDRAFHCLPARPAPPPNSPHPTRERRRTPAPAHFRSRGEHGDAGVLRAW